jgi:hypothetical protein
VSRNFQKKVENFTCENCGKTVVGNGYTNHCPHCLHSKHVDLRPGDRDCTCQGMMSPISITTERDGYTITFKCQKCGEVKRCKSAENDDFNVILEIVKKGRLIK